MELDEAARDENQCRFVVLPIAYDGTATFMKGARFGPDAILAASEHLELFDAQLGREFHQAGIFTHEHVIDEDCSPERAQELIFAAAVSLVQADKTIIGLGGEHSVSFGLVRAVKQRWPGISVLQFDAHADLRNSYHDSKLNHACVMRRIVEMQVPTVSVGVRAYELAEYEFIQANNLTVISPEQVAADLPGCIDKILGELSNQVYVTFDIDALDPSIAPGTGTPEPGGLNYPTALAILEAVGRNKQIVGADIVEVMPIPGSCVTEYVAARLVYKLIAFAQL